MKDLRLEFLRLITTGILAAFTLGLHAQQYTATVVENALSAVVTVAVYKVDVAKKLMGFRGNSDVAYERQLDLGGAQSSGSGFVILNGNKKYIVTNAHVVEDAKDDDKSIYVYSIDQSRYEVKILGGDSFYDFAILEFVDPPGPEITTLAFAAQEPRVGDRVYAIGNPLGEYPYSVSDGIISAKNRVRNSITGKFGFLQSTATVIWGNSGGPLINIKGEVVGINSQIAFAEQANLWQPQINFALESEICKRLANDIFNNQGRVVRAYLGLEATESYLEEEDPLTGYSSWKVQGNFPVLQKVFADSPLFDSLQHATGNYITRINGHLVRNIEELLGELEKLRPGKPATISLLSLDLMDSANFAFTPAELTPEKLSVLPSNTMALDTQFTIMVKDSVLLVTYTPSEPLDAGFTDHEEGAPQAQSAPADYTVVGLGSRGSYASPPEMYRIQTLADLGAALRLYGLNGGYDLFLKPLLTDDPDGYEDVFYSRYYLSQDEWTLKKVLWY